MKYTPHTETEIKEMLADIGVSSVSELFKDIPESLRTRFFDIPKPFSEYEIIEHFQKIGKKNKTDLLLFTGGGYYDHYIPSAVDALSSRAEFYTAYTPYQPEAAQGTLQSLYEYQTAVCAITGMDAANASLYDGGTGVAEAVLMSFRLTNRNKVIIDGSLNPIYKKILHTYLDNLDFTIIEIPHQNYGTNREKIASLIDDDTASIVVQNPNFFGTIDDFQDIADMIHEKGGLLIQTVYPLSLGMLKTPGETGADITVGDGQSLGNPLSFGGPYFGFIAVKIKHIRQLPGRIVGETEDKNGKRAFVLTLQAREQHIKRHKATSNICSNQNLIALRGLFYLSLIGKKGFQVVASQNYQKAHFTLTELLKIKGVSLKNKNPFFNEFVLELPKNASETVEKMLSKGIAAGIPLSLYTPEDKNALLVSVTEKRTKEEIMKLAETMGEVLWN
ncbi:MAG: glycine dehydrogenase (aminomethyl-transferring) [Spirochaetes bacterium GWB1_36_13]|nr:MAG: glycine dehydrogenase (aminomethyl-transferring) [Spirochaetes bacterium GWB1_36_13]